MEAFYSTTIAIFTVVLAAATIALVWYTKELVAATRELVRFQERDKRRSDLKTALELTEALRMVNEQEFVKQVSNPGRIPQPESTQIRQLDLLNAYIGDSDTRLYLNQLVQWLDTVQQGSSIGGNGPTIARLLRDVKDRLGWCITEWRNELRS